MLADQLRVDVVHRQGVFLRRPRTSPLLICGTEHLLQRCGLLHAGK